MTKREKYLGGMLLLILVVLAHIFIGVSLKKKYASQTAELDGLQTTYRNYSMMGPTTALISEEVEW